MSDAEKGKREWRFYLDDMIAFAQKVQTYTAGLDQAGFVPPMHGSSVPAQAFYDDANDIDEASSMSRPSAPSLPNGEQQRGEERARGPNPDKLRQKNPCTSLGDEALNAQR